MLLLIGFTFFMQNHLFAEIIFSKSYGTSNCYEEGYSLIPFQNNYLCTAAQLCTNGSNQWENKWFLVDEQGDSISLTNNNYSGFTKKLNNGDFIVYGGEKAGLVFDSVFIHRINAQGQWLWTYKSFWPNCRNTPNDVLEDDAGNIYVCGIFGTGNCNNPTYQSFILKLDGNGNKIWNEAYIYGGTSSLQFYDLKLKNNFIYTAGFVDSLTQYRKAHYAKLDTAGNYVWWKTISNTNNNLDGYSIAYMNDQLYVLAYDDTVRLFICDTMGNFQSYKGLGPSCGSRYFEISKSLDKYLLVLANKSINGSCMSTFSKLDSNGNTIWEKPFQALLRTYSEIDSGAYLLAGYTGPLPKVKLIRFDTTYTSRPPNYSSISNIEQNSFKLYPNPTSGSFKVEFQYSSEPQQIELYNSKGKLVSSWETIHNQTYSIPSFITNGLYFVKVINGESNAIRKLVLFR